MAALMIPHPEASHLSSSGLQSEASAYAGTLQRLIAKKVEHQSMDADILARINHWEHSMIERVRQKAERAREQLSRLRGSDEKEVIEDTQRFVAEIRTKIAAESVLQDDLERLKQKIDQLTQTLARATKQGDLQLYIEPSHMIDWNHLIYVHDKSAVSEPTVSDKKASTKISSSKNDSAQRLVTDSRITSNGSLKSEETDVSTHTQRAPLPIYRSPSTVIGSTTSINVVQDPATVKRRRPPFLIADPASRKTVGLPSLNPLLPGDKSTHQTDFRARVASLFKSSSPPPTDKA